MEEQLIYYLFIHFITLQLCIKKILSVYRERDLKRERERERDLRPDPLDDHLYTLIIDIICFSCLIFGPNWFYCSIHILYSCLSV